jgi:hypothetical protein
MSRDQVQPAARENTHEWKGSPMTKAYMTAEQVRDVILAETKSGMTTKQIADLRFANVKIDTIKHGLRLALEEVYIARRRWWVATLEEKMRRATLEEKLRSSSLKRKKASGARRRFLMLAQRQQNR